MHTDDLHPLPPAERARALDAALFSALQGSDLDPPLQTFTATFTYGPGRAKTGTSCRDAVPIFGPNATFYLHADGAHTLRVTSFDRTLVEAEALAAFLEKALVVANDFNHYLTHVGVAQ